MLGEILGFAVLAGMVGKGVATISDAVSHPQEAKREIEKTVRNAGENVRSSFYGAAFNISIATYVKQFREEECTSADSLGIRLEEILQHKGTEDDPFSASDEAKICAALQILNEGCCSKLPMWRYLEKNGFNVEQFKED